MRYAFLIVACLALAACDPAGIGELDSGGGSIMWDDEGKAYLVEYHMSNTYTVKRLPHVDREQQAGGQSDE